jgi:hypothetical protein
LRILLDHHLLDGPEEELPDQGETLIEEIMENNADIIKLSAVGEEAHFFSSRFMSEAYARILIQKQSDSLLLIADLVRRNSALYPRPTPLEIFEQVPFDLTKEEVHGCLSQMANGEEYQDIQQTRSSLGNIFLFSTLHLEPEYAAMLAEWVDVGLADNP